MISDMYEVNLSRMIIIRTSWGFVNLLPPMQVSAFRKAEGFIGMS